jgi:hypothetical protein
MSGLREFRFACPWRAMRRAIAAVCLLGLGAWPALAEQYHDIEVIVEPQAAVEGSPPENRSGGYIEYRVTVRNHSATVDHRVRLSHPSNSISYFGDYLQRNTRLVRVDRDSTLVVSLFQPSLPIFDENLIVEIDGIRQKELVALPCPVGRRMGFGRVTSPTLLVLASRGILQELKDKVRAAHADQVVFCRSELPTDEWSPNWLGYTAYDAILLTHREAESLPAEVLLALRRYVEVGGIVLVQGDLSDSKLLVPEALCDADLVADADGAFHVGFGLVRPCPTMAPWPGEFWLARGKGFEAPVDREVQIVSEVTVPVRGLLLVVICFAIGIGPVNVWLLSRRDKKMWLWWIVPTVSLATCLAVFGFSLASEGITGRGRTALITLLDENTHRATTLGYASYYCPLTPSDGLHFSYDTEVSQLQFGAPAGPGLGSGRGKSLDWTNDQHLDSGWIVARVPACFAIRKSETRRERLAIRKAADGKVTAVNGLGVPIESLYYVDENGVVGVATDLPEGAERVLEPHTAKSNSPATVTSSTEVEDGPASTPTETEAAPPLPVGIMPPAGSTLPLITASTVDPAPGERVLLRAVFDQAWNISLRELRSTPEKFVAPGCYVAVVKRNPFLEDPLVSAPQEGSIGVIYGISARVGDGR